VAGLVVSANGVDGVVPLQVATVAPCRLAQPGAFARREVEAAHAATLRLRIQNVRIRGILLRHEAVSTTNIVPHRVGDRPLFATARATPRAVVLQSAADAIRHRVVGRDVVELTERNGVGEQPVAATVVRDACRPPSLPR
jgi:hypothetical protein